MFEGDIPFLKRGIFRHCPSAPFILCMVTKCDMLFLGIILFVSSINFNFQDVNNDVSKDLSIYVIH